MYWMLAFVVLLLVFAGYEAREAVRSWGKYARPAAPKTSRRPFILWGALVVGALIGRNMAAKVAMTAMPELVALLHSFVGLAAVLGDVDGSGRRDLEVVDPRQHAVHSHVVVVDDGEVVSGGVVAPHPNRFLRGAEREYVCFIII